jgi:D-glycero-D-manno-heptose 1,7-bisphosphate phosphatase
VGDSERDLAAARAVGARPLLVLTGNGRRTRQALDRRQDSVETYDDLLGAAKALVGEST